VLVLGTYFAIYLYERLVYINNRPKNKEELFNLRHSSARNVIERIFGVLKRRFRILLLAPEYNLDIQARIPAALCAIHNFIVIHNPDEEQIHAGDENDENGDDNAPFDNHHDGAQAAGAGFDGPSVRRDNIAQAMWDDYLAVRLERGIDSDDESETESDNDDE
jgi:DDE superfamily endonuclease